MRKRLLSIVGLSVVMLAGASPALSQVNCGIVNKDLKMGRTPQDIAERMMISVDDIKKCEAEAKAKEAAAPAAGAGEKAADKAKEAAH